MESQKEFPTASMGSYKHTESHHTVTSLPVLKEQMLFCSKLDCKTSFSFLLFLLLLFLFFTFAQPVKIITQTLPDTVVQSSFRIPYLEKKPCKEFWVRRSRAHGIQKRHGRPEVPIYSQTLVCDWVSRASCCQSEHPTPMHILFLTEATTKEE